jgi:adenylate cyclase
MRWLPNIRYGTERYPDHIARRLRTLNITAWAVAAISASFGLMRLLVPSQGGWKSIAINAIGTLFFASMPLLHRFGPLAAPLGLGVAAYAFVCAVTIRLGTGAGVYLHLLPITALGNLFLGTERPALTVLFSVLAAGLIIALHLFVPQTTGVLSPSAMLANFTVHVVMVSAILFAVVRYAFVQMTRAEAAAEREFQRSEALLGNILPPGIAARLKQQGGSVIADRYEHASALFADMAGSTTLASNIPPEQLVHFLNGVFTKVDALVERHGLEKIKTTGDGYMVVSGVPEPRADHAEALAAFALDLRDCLSGLTDPRGRPVPIRIGLASGPVVAGVIGTRKFFYDVWGDAVNMASRMQTTGEVGEIQVPDGTYELIKGEFVLCERGQIEVRGKGPMRTWLLVSARSSERSSSFPRIADTA